MLIIYDYNNNVTKQMYKLNNLFIFWKFSVFFQENTTSNLTIIVMHSGITRALLLVISWCMYHIRIVK